ncbi:MAG: 50S ribosomal protein L13 [Nitrosopumilus sp.]|nr:50S ribosomal protein L13 [Nitrosopumilus sp.]MDA7997903.1 50S ribosomal protein L13 [Nitrosopumilus sp.]
MASAQEAGAEAAAAQEIKDVPEPAGTGPAEAQEIKDIPESAGTGQGAARKGRAGADWPIVVDGTGHIAGRLASRVAKLLIQGNRVSVINCEKIMISGTRSNIIAEYRDFLRINSVIHPRHGPVHRRRPDTILTRMVRGMLPYGKKPSGVAAHRRLRAYVGSPRELRPLEKTRFEDAQIRRESSRYTTMEDLGRTVGWT